MPELLTPATMLRILRDLAAVFPSRGMPDDQLVRRAEVYRDGLAGFDAEAVGHAARRAIQEDNFFPKVARLRELAAAYVTYHRQHRADVAGAIDDPLYCAQCRARCEWIRRWRPQVDHESGRWLVSANGQYVLLELYDRLLCECAPRCTYLPDPHLAVDAMPISAMPFARPTKRTTVVVEVAA